MRSTIGPADRAPLESSAAMARATAARPQYPAPPGNPSNRPPSPPALSPRPAAAPVVPAPGLPVRTRGGHRAPPPGPHDCTVHRATTIASGARAPPAGPHGWRLRTSVLDGGFA